MYRDSLRRHRERHGAAAGVPASGVDRQADREAERRSRRRRRGAIGEHAELGDHRAVRTGGRPPSGHASPSSTRVLSDLIAQARDARSAAAMAARGTTQDTAQRDAAAHRARRHAATRSSRDLNTSFNGTYVFCGATASTPRRYAMDASGPVSAYAGSTAEDGGRHRSQPLRQRSRSTDSAITQGVRTAGRLRRVRQPDRGGARRRRRRDGHGIARARRGMFDRVSTAQSRVGADLRTIDEQKLRLGEMQIAPATSGCRRSKTPTWPRPSPA